MTTIYKPTYTFNGMKFLNPDNVYVIDAIGWHKGDEQAIMSSAVLSKQLESLLGFKNVGLRQFEEEQITIFPVGIVDHMQYGALAIGIVDGPDYEVIQQAFDPNVIPKIIAEKAQFKHNVHEMNSTTRH